MPRTALVVSYDGQSYHGWQYQSPELPTVQLHLMRAVSEVASQEVSLHCAGRTDAGVHAIRQVVHFDHQDARPDKAWVQGVNAHLEADIAVQWAGQVAADFDARRTARARRYLYLIHNSRVRSALFAGKLTFEHRLLDVEAMHRSAQALLGEQDFSAFRAANCQSRSPWRNVFHVSVTRHADLVVIDISANAFLHHMVRNVAGALMDVGSGVRSEGWIAELMKARDRTMAGVTAAPEGLYLADVIYPSDAGIPEGPEFPHLFQSLLLLNSPSFGN